MVRISIDYQLLDLDKDDAEAKGIEPTTGKVVDPDRGAAALVGAPPVTAPVHAFRAITVVASRKLRLLFAAVVIPVVQTPFQNIPAHVVQAELVRFLLSHGMRLEFGIITIPRHIVGFIASAIFVAFAFLAAPRRILPLRFRRKRELPTVRSLA